MTPANIFLPKGTRVFFNGCEVLVATDTVVLANPNDVPRMYDVQQGDVKNADQSD